MKQNVYEIEKNVEKLLRGGSTGFLTCKIGNEVQRRLKKKSFFIYSPFDEAEKIILYTSLVPSIRLFKICCYKGDELKHSAIMGSLFGLNITNEKFGDIIRWNNNFYVYLLDDICNFVIEELKMIGNIPVFLEEVDLDFLNNFKREYKKYEIIVSSLRIDTIISRLIGSSRDTIADKLHNKEIFLNDDIVNRASDVLNVGDVFSVRRHGKFKFRAIIGKTKKNNYILEIDKYV